MSRPPDLYSPWDDPEERVSGRHVGREEEERALRLSVQAFVAGGAPLPVYVFGPRGCGKSHLLVRLRTAVEHDASEAGAAVVVVPEDIPEMGDVDALLARMDPRRRPAWTTWTHGPEPPEAPGVPRLVLFEGFDRQLRALARKDRRVLRKRLEGLPRVHLIATGVALGPELTRRDEAFHAAFDPLPLGPLGEEDARRLLERLGGDASSLSPSGRETLLTLAGGSPRALVALGEACRDPEVPSVVAGLRRVISGFTSHYQLRYRDLSPLGQRALEVLALAPREVRSGEIAARLGQSTAGASTLLARLADAGVVRRRAEGRRAWYRLAEPLFRFWIEYRTSSWEETRVGWLAGLLESLLTPEELAGTWWAGGSEEERQAALAAISRDTTAWAAAMWKAYLALHDEGLTPDWATRFEQLTRQADPDLVAWVADKALSAAPGDDEPLALTDAERASLVNAPGLRTVPLAMAALRPEDWQQARLSAPDADLPAALCVAHAGQDGVLLARVVALLGADHHFLLPCPAPERPVAVGADRVVRLMWRLPLWGLSWAASLGVASDAAFDAALAALPPSFDAEPATELGPFLALQALSALALRARPRFDRLAAALGGWAGDCAERAALLADQLAEHERGHLQPELEALRSRLVDEA